MNRIKNYGIEQFVDEIIVIYKIKSYSGRSHKFLPRKSIMPSKKIESKESRPISAEASNFLSLFRQNKAKESTKPIDKKSEQMEIQSEQNQVEKIEPELNHMDMESDSALEAEELFGNLMPLSPQEKKQKSPIKPKQSKSSNSKPKKATSIVEEQKIIQTKSILKKGNMTSEKPHKSEKSENSESEEQEKVEQQKPKRRTVQFEGILPLNSQLEKKWKDPVQNQRKGKFDKEEEGILSEAVGKFLVTNDISLEEFEQLLTEGERSDKTSKKQKIFSLLSTALPNRTPQSCYKYLKRNFNSLNRKGKWTEEEVDKLKILVQKYGRKWTIISKELKRSADNCYDKFRELGDENMEDRVKGIWKFEEVVELLKLIQKMTKIKFLDHKVDKELQRAEIHDASEREEVMSRKYNSKNFIFHNIAVLKPFMNAKNFQKIDISKIRWNEIATYLKTRNTLDCRNKIVTLLQIFFHSETKELDQQIVEFFITHKFQSQYEIDWKEWKHKEITWEQTKNRYMIMKKMVEGRSVMPFKEIIVEIKRRIDKRNQQKKALKKVKSKPRAVQIIEEDE